MIWLEVNTGHSRKDKEQKIVEENSQIGKCHVTVISVLSLAKKLRDLTIIFKVIKLLARLSKKSG